MAPDAADTAFELSPLVLADHLITLAKEVDQQGYVEIASSLLTLVDRALDYPPRRSPGRGTRTGGVDRVPGRGYDSFRRRSLLTAVEGRPCTKQSMSGSRTGSPATTPQ